MLALLADIGSTYTKLSAVDLDRAVLVAQSQSLTTPEDIARGVEAAQSRIEMQLGGWPDFCVRRAASSAAGGLELIAIGHVPDLTGEAARLAALGAGAKVCRTFSYRLQASDMEEIRRLDPDIILLSGGTDGGDGEVLLHNAALLTAERCAAAVVVAGNRDATPEAVLKLRAGGITARSAANVLPRLGQVAVDGARAAIREIFLERIICAKGLKKVEQSFGEILMPTPAAVLQGLQLLAKHQGDLLAVDIGGATTDVYSLAEGKPTDDTIVPVGLRPPYAQRTVEADLGIRISAPEVVKIARDQLDGAGDQLAAGSREWSAFAAMLQREPSWVPQDEVEVRQEIALAKACISVAVERHVGRLEILSTPSGKVCLLHGKDLRDIRLLVGTGGILRHLPEPTCPLQGALGCQRSPFALKPERPRLTVDRNYILAAAGLLVDCHGQVALQLMQRSLGLAAESPS